MIYYLFHLFKPEDLAEIQQELIEKGLQHPFILEENNQIFIGGQSNRAITTQKAKLVEKKKARVDWEEQWSLFAENFFDGKAHIPIDTKTLLLEPGAGFGDLSHPTTALMLEMMKERVEGKPVIDIGTGSGVLALAALLLGARSAIGIDIDPEALKHARKNAKLNHLKARFFKSLPSSIKKPSVFLMNMIFPEQKELNQYQQSS